MRMHAPLSAAGSLYLEGRRQEGMILCQHLLREPVVHHPPPKTGECAVSCDMLP